MKNISIPIFCFLVLFSCGQTEKTIGDFIKNNNIQEVTAWLDAGGDVNALVDGKDPLIYVAAKVRDGGDLVKLLINRGANPENGVGKETPLMNAARGVNLRGAEYLLASRADPSKQNEAGKTALDLVGECGGCPEKATLTKLIKDYQKINVPTRVMYACNAEVKMEVAYHRGTAAVRILEKGSEEIAFHTKKAGKTDGIVEYVGDGYVLYSEGETCKVEKGGEILFELCNYIGRK